MANLRFVVSLTTKENDYQLEQAASAQTAARKLGVSLQILYADNDAITQSTQLLKAIQSDAVLRPHAIVFEPAGGTAFPQVAQAAVSAQHAVESWVRLNATNKVQIDVVGAQNDLMATGARKAFENVSNIADRERWLRLPFTGVDGLAKTGQAWVRTGTLAATVVVPTNAGEAISMLVEALKTGKDVPEPSLTMPEAFPATEKLKPSAEHATPIA